MLLHKSVKLISKITIFIAVFNCILTLSFFLSAAFASRAGIQLVFSSDKSQYAANEPVLVDIRLINNSKNNLWVNKRFYLGTDKMPENERDWYILVTTPSGEKLESKYSFAAGFPKSDFFQNLEPGQEAAAERPRNIRGFYDFQEPGTYRLQAVYENVFGKEIGLDAFKNKLSSEAVEIKILGS